MNKRILSVALALVLAFSVKVPVSATTISEAKNKKSAAESKLKDINKNIDALEDEKETIEEEAEEVKAQLVDLLLSIDVIKSDIKNKETEITAAQAAYEEALANEIAQQEAMNKRIKYMYEKGEKSYVEILLTSRNFADAINKQSYAEKLYEYDRYLLFQYVEAKEEVKRREMELQDDLAELEEIQKDLEEQEVTLQETIDQYSESIENFEDQLISARSKAKEYKFEITQQTNNIKTLEEAEKKRLAEEAKKKAEEEAKKKAAEEAALKKAKEEAEKAKKEAEEKGEVYVETNMETSQPQEEQQQEQQTSQQQSSGGSAKGQEIANFACQFVGNPYVAGGTSLTNGADCSGFTQAVYSNFGISLPRTSGSQALVGREVSYAEAAPGDIIYYGGHVGIYIGNGMIVHASTPATGIKITNALYRSIITVRRIV